VAQPGMQRNDDGTVTLVLNGGRELRLNPLSVTQNRELRDARYDLEEWAFTADREHRERFGDVKSGTYDWVEARRSTRESVAEVERRNLTWVRRLVELTGGGAELPGDEEMPPWLATTADLLELQSMLSSRPEPPQGRG